jgi:hypothetical protein
LDKLNKHGEDAVRLIQIAETKFPNKRFLGKRLQNGLRAFLLYLEVYQFEFIEVKGNPLAQNAAQLLETIGLKLALLVNNGFAVFKVAQTSENLFEFASTHPTVVQVNSVHHLLVKVLTRARQSFAIANRQSVVLKHDGLVHYLVQDGQCTVTVLLALQVVLYAGIFPVCCFVAFFCFACLLQLRLRLVNVHVRHFLYEVPSNSAHHCVVFLEQARDELFRFFLCR